MELIDKAAVVAEMEKRVQEAEIIVRYVPSSALFGLIQAYKNVLSFLDTIETKEVDLENEISDYLTSYHLHIKDGGRVVFDNDDSPNFMCDIRHIAKHFFELGLNAQKGE